MKIKSLRLQNFMLYQKFFRIFGDKDVIGIVAEYENNKHRSNKGGKSTIIEAIRYAFYGDSRASRDTDLIHYGQDVMLVEVEFDNGSYIKRGRDRKNHGLLEVDKITNADDAQKRINELVGHDSASDFVLTRFFLQQDINQFMQMQPRQKQKYLMQWLNSDHWLKLERMALDDLNILNKKLSELKSKQVTLLEDLRDIDLLKAELISENDLLDNYKIKRVELEANISEVKKLLLSKDEEKSLQSRVVLLQRNIVSLEKELKTKQEFRNKAKELQIELDKKSTFTVKTDVQTEERIRSRLGEEIIKETDLVNKIAIAEKQHTGVCPILKQTCDRIILDSKKLGEWKKEIVAVQLKQKKFRSELAEISLARQAARHRESMQSNFEVYQARSIGLDATESNLAATRNELDGLKNQIVDGISEANAQVLKELLNELRQLNEDIDESGFLIGRIKERIQISLKTKKRIDKLNEIMAKKEKRIEIQKYVAFMFGRSGIPAQEIENGFDEIEEETNYVLRKFGLDLSIMFQPMRELNTWEPACIACSTVFPKGSKNYTCQSCGVERQKKMKDELTVGVLEGSEEHDFNMESGGGKTIISFSNRLALTRLKQRKINSEFNVLFLDEPDSSLDKPNKRSFMDLVTKTLISKFGFEQIFWITHDPTIQEFTPHVLKVVRHEKHSTTRWL